MTHNNMSARIGRMTQSDLPSNPAYHRVLNDYVDYHVVFVIVGGLFTLVLLLSCAFFWLRLRRAPKDGERKWTFERKTYFSFAALSVVIGLMMAVVLAANVSTVLSPQPGLSGALGTLGTAQSNPLAVAFTEWMRSGNAHIPPLIQSKIDDRLAWQVPKAITCSILLVAFAALSVRLWRVLIARSKSGGIKRNSLLFTSANVSAAACFVLMLMVIGNTEAAFAPLTITLLYG